MKFNEKISIIAEWFFHYEEPATGRKWTLGPFKNKVVQGGLENMAALLIGEVPSPTAAMHCVIGSNDAAANINDTIADMTEVARMPIASKTRTGAMAVLRSYWGINEGIGDHQCAGIVARSTDQAESGVLLHRIVQPFSKAANMTLTIEVRVTYQGVG
jgi:hypothetical protein